MDSIKSEDPNPGGFSRLPKKIVSGGQTGVDRGALDAAIEQDFPAGGYCPEGRKAEDGRIPDRYPVIEIPGTGYEIRTERNVIDSDGTLIIYFFRLSGGTEQTVEYCKDRQKPCLLIDAENTSLSDALANSLRFVSREHIKILNVAGPRNSQAPQAYQYARKLVTLIIQSTTEEGQN